MKVARAYSRGKARNAQGALKNAQAHSGDHEVKVYDIDEYEKMMSRGPDGVVASHLELPSGGLLAHIRNGTNHLLDEIADLTSGPFPTTNNAARMGPAIEDLREKVMALPAAEQGNVMLKAPSAAEMAQLMAPAQVPMPQVAQPGVMAMAPSVPMMPAVVQSAPMMPATMQPATMVALPQVAGTVHNPEQLAEQTTNHVNEVLQSTFTASGVPHVHHASMRYDHFLGIAILVILIIFAVAACIVRIKKRKKAAKQK
ncbi:anonymous antigen-4 [Babesia caballi]|uniref:Anonymous antigen-4 n=1 Tax=Babesia caballi TaxID=5871 RepID=A0AAV4LQI4_BABCB|nr:anonymous antigen-4 [Babesia caballi]